MVEESSLLLPALTLPLMALLCSAVLLGAHPPRWPGRVRRALARGLATTVLALGWTLVLALVVLVWLADRLDRADAR